MTDSDKFDWNKAADNWGKLLSESGQSFWDTVTDEKTWSSLGESSSDATMAILSELGELGTLGAEEAQKRLKPLLDSAVEKGEMTTQQATQLTKELFNGDISWDDTKTYLGEKKDDFAAWSKKVGAGASELGGNLLRSVPFLGAALATAVTIFSISNGIMGVESFWSIKGVFSAIFAFGIASVVAPAVGAEVHNWWYEHNGTPSPDSVVETPVVQASLAAAPEQAVDVASLDPKKLRGITATSVQYDPNAQRTELIAGLPSDNNPDRTIGA